MSKVKKENEYFDDDDDAEVESLSGEEEDDDMEPVKEAEESKKRKKTTIKKAASGYSFFMKERQQQIKEENPELSFGLISKKVGAEWKAMDDAAKKPYLDKAAEDKKRYEREKELYPELVGNKKQKKKKKTEKDPDAPKKYKNSYMFFTQEIRPKVIEELGNDANVKATVVMKVVGTRWNQLTPEEKEPYEKMAQQDKERYLREMEEYKKKKAAA